MFGGGAWPWVTCSRVQRARVAGQLQGYETLGRRGKQSFWKLLLWADPTGWHLIFLDQLKSLRTYRKGPILQRGKEVVSLTNQCLCRLHVWTHLVGRPVIFLGPHSLPLHLWHTPNKPKDHVFSCEGEVPKLALKTAMSICPREEPVTRVALEK